MDDSVCDIKAGTLLADLLIKASLIIWDEAPMTHKYAFEALDRSLRDIMSTVDDQSHLKPFGGKTILLGGDFRQTLPVIAQGSRHDSILASINRSYLWDSFHIFVLSQNMRVRESEVDFVKWLLMVGDGTASKVNNATYKYSGEDRIYVDDSLLLQSENDPITALASHVYTSFQENYTNIDYLRERAILSPRNDTVDEINTEMLNWVPGKSQVYSSVDSINSNEYEGADFNFEYPIEYLNSMNFPNFPQHKLSLKINSPVMLLRNICQADGLCNGTRLVIKRLGTRVIEAKIITGHKAGLVMV